MITSHHMSQRYLRLCAHMGDAFIALEYCIIALHRCMVICWVFEEYSVVLCICVLAEYSVALCV